MVYLKAKAQLWDGISLETKFANKPVLIADLTYLILLRVLVWNLHKDSSQAGESLQCDGNNDESANAIEFSMMVLQWYIVRVNNSARQIEGCFCSCLRILIKGCCKWSIDWAHTMRRPWKQLLPSCIQYAIQSAEILIFIAHTRAQFCQPLNIVAKIGACRACFIHLIWLKRMRSCARHFLRRHQSRKMHLTAFHPGVSHEILSSVAHKWKLKGFSISSVSIVLYLGALHFVNELHYLHLCRSIACRFLCTNITNLICSAILALSCTTLMLHSKFNGNSNNKGPATAQFIM